jgi:hypothetical protein
VKLNRIGDIISTHAGDLHHILISVAIALAAFVLGLVLQKILTFFLSHWPSRFESTTW